MKITLSLILLITGLSSAQINWFRVGNGANGQVLDITTDTTGIYFAGYFTQIDSVQANCIARWNGFQWETFPNNFTQVNSVSVRGNEIFVGASTNDLIGCFRWNGINWDTVGIIPGGNISTIAFDDSNLYVAGFFNSISGLDAASVARWDGNQWYSMGNDFQFEQIHSLILYRNQLYAGGTFIRPLKNLWHIARWEDTSWVPVNGGANLPVTSMYVYNDTLFVAGHFSQVGNFSGGSGIPANRIARWDGDNWSAIGSGLSGTPEDLTVNAGYIYVVGNFSGPNPPFEVIYKWDGNGWNLLATANGLFSDISFFKQENSFYCGGNFSNINTIGAANNLVRFVDSSIITSTETTNDDYNPNNLFLYQNYPNPFNPSTKIKFSIPSVIASGAKQSQFVSLKVYDVLGNKVATLVNEEKSAGSYEVTFDASNIASGLYLYRLEAGTFTDVKRMLLLK